MSSSKRPVAALALHRRRVVESGFGRARAVSTIFHRVGADAVRAALLEGMAGLALLGRRLAFFHRGFGKQRFDRLLGLLVAAPPFSSPASLTAMSKPGFAGFCGAKTAPAAMLSASKIKAGAEDGAEDLVEFEGIHRKAAPGAGRDGGATTAVARRRR